MTIEIPKNVEAIEVVGLKEWLEEHDKQIRADAIDECIDIVEHSFECFLSGTAQGCVRWNMEQLKEKK